MPAGAQATAKKPPLAKADIDDIARLEMIEDRREFDDEVLERIAGSKHPEVRRRAALTIARLFDFRGRGLLRGMRADADTAVSATVVFATGQLLDTTSVSWLDSLMQSSRTPVGVAVEAAGALGKIRTSDSRMRLALYLSAAPEGAKAAPVVGEALLSIGRHSDRGDIKPIVRWAASKDEQLRWRATWALFRGRDPAAVADLLNLARDSSAEVRFWAMRGLTGPRADSSDVTAAGTLATLNSGVRDADRRVAAEAVRALGTHSDATSMLSLILSLEDEDSWVSSYAAEALGARGERAKAAVAQLAIATGADRSVPLRVAALNAIADIWLASALQPAMELSVDPSPTVRLAAARVLARLGVGGREGLVPLMKDAKTEVRAVAQEAWLILGDTLEDRAASRAARRTALASADVAVRQAAARSMRSWADTTDIPLLLDSYARALRDTSPEAATAVVGALSAMQRRAGVGTKEFFARNPRAPNDVQWGVAARAFGGAAVIAWGPGRPMQTTRTEADYRKLVEQYVVPDYNGAPKPRVQWELKGGKIELELNAGDAPLATDTFLGYVANGKFPGVTFERVVPNFVAQQGNTDPSESLQRDEISRRRLLRGTLAWGSAIGATRRPGQAFDTGPAVYTLGITPQPHNEGDFTALGRVVKGMELVDRIELGDVLVRATRLPTAPSKP